MSKFRLSQKITPALWFDGKAEEAVAFYSAIFEDSKVVNVVRATDAGPLPAGTALGITFELAGQQFMAINGGPEFQFSPAVSLFVSCDSQAEVDELWDKLTADGGSPWQCGWLKDKYGLCWQIVPEEMMDYISDSDVTRATRAVTAMYEMEKLDLAALRRAWEGDTAGAAAP